MLDLGQKRASVRQLTPTLVLMLTLSSLAISVRVPNVNAASQGPNSPGTVTTDGSGASWDDPKNVVKSDGQRASVWMYTSGLSERLIATDFQFNIPASNAITGIKVEIERYKTDATIVMDSEIRVVKSDGSLGGANKADLPIQWPTGVAREAYHVYGGDGDLWGESWSASDINDQHFGVAVRILMEVVDPSWQWFAYINHIRITVYHETRPVESLRSENTPIPLAAFLGIIIIATAACVVKCMQTRTRQLRNVSSCTIGVRNCRHLL